MNAVREHITPFIRVARGIPPNWPDQCVLTYQESTPDTGRYSLNYLKEGDGVGLPTIADWRRLALGEGGEVSQSITKSVTWHPGGAQRGEDGEPVPWPWGERVDSPVIWGKSNRFVHTFAFTVTRQSWRTVEWWCDRAEMEPPTAGGADGTE